MKLIIEAVTAALVKILSINIFNCVFFAYAVSSGRSFLAHNVEQLKD